MLITTSEVATKTATSVAATSPSACRNSGVEGARLMPASGASWRARDLRREDVALVAHGADQLLARAAVVELAPQAADLHVDGAVEGVGLRPAGEFQQLVARRAPAAAARRRRAAARTRRWRGSPPRPRASAVRGARGRAASRRTRRPHRGCRRPAARGGGAAPRARGPAARADCRAWAHSRRRRVPGRRCGRSPRPWPRA